MKNKVILDLIKTWFDEAYRHLENNSRSFPDQRPAAARLLNAQFGGSTRRTLSGKTDLLPSVSYIMESLSLSLLLRCGKEDKRDVEEGEKRREQGKWIGTRSKSVELILLAVFHLYFLVSRSESVLSTLEGRKRLDFHPFFQLKIWFLFRSFFNRALVYCSLVSFDSL